MLDVRVLTFVGHVVVGVHHRPEPRGDRLAAKFYHAFHDGVIIEEEFNVRAVTGVFVRSLRRFLGDNEAREETAPSSL